MSLAVVTGATGFLGPFVVRALCERFPALQLRCVVRASSQIAPICVPGVASAVADLRDPDALYAAFQGADTLINLASLGFDWSENVVRTAQRANIRRAVFISTTAILTALPVASKPVRARGEELVRQSGLEWTILRPTMIYGTPKDRNIARLIRLIDVSPVIPLFAPSALQQPVHVEDVAWAVAAAVGNERTVHQTYNLSGARPLTMESLAQEVTAALGRRRLFVRVPLRPVIGVLSLWERLRRPPISAEQVRRVGEDKSCDYAEAARDFDFSPRDFRAGIRSEVALFRHLS